MLRLDFTIFILVLTRLVFCQWALNQPTILLTAVAVAMKSECNVVWIEELWVLLESVYASHFIYLFTNSCYHISTNGKAPPLPHEN